MPFLRYDSGDLAVPSEDTTMSYGSLPFTVDDFIGRQTDMITCSDGRKLAGVNFYTMMYKIEGVEMFQIIQKDVNNIEVQFIPSLNSQTIPSDRFVKVCMIEWVIVHWISYQ